MKSGPRHFGQRNFGHSFIDSTQSGFQWVADRMWKVEHAFERVNAASQERMSNVRMRIFFILVSLSVMYLVLAGFAMKSALAGTGATGGLPVMANTRADLVDRNGYMLATDVFNYDLFVDPTEMTGEDRPLVRRALITLLPDMPREALDKAMNSKGPTIVMGMLKASDRAILLSHGLPGVSFEPAKVRGYPLGVTGSFYVGGTERGGGGVAGIERALNTQIIEAGKRGQKIELAMDMRVQGALENELRAGVVKHDAVAAVGLVTNIHTGEVIAMANWPEYDPNKMGQHTNEEKLNRAAASRYEVGSIFKVISIAIGLETGTASLNSVYDARSPYAIGRRKISDFHAKNKMMTLEDVFVNSSNIGTTLLAKDVGIDSMTKYYEALGLFRAADIELYESATPIVPKKWSEGALASTSFGHGISISPLSFAQATGAVLNGGYLRPLTLLKRDPSQPLKGERVFSASTSRHMLDLMRVNVLKGSGARANAPGLRVGGKTGSADKPTRGGYDKTNIISSFAAVFPSDGPVDQARYLVVIMYDSPKGTADTHGFRGGGWIAAPVAGRVIDRIAPFVGVARGDDKFSLADWDKARVILDDQTGTAVADNGQ